MAKYKAITLLSSFYEQSLGAFYSSTFCVISNRQARKFIGWIKHKNETERTAKTRWESDNNLEGSKKYVHTKFLHLVIQYSLVTMFAAALPITPLIAYINNLVEIRLRASEFLILRRRAVDLKKADIGEFIFTTNVKKKRKTGQ